jgi:general secretion pathway protein K
MSKARHGERGFALLIVLWSLAFLSLIIVGLMATCRREVKLAENLRDAAKAEAAADGATYQAIFRLIAGEWSPGPVLHVVHIGGAKVTVQIEDTANLVNPNNAPVPLLAALLHEVGADPQSAQTIAAAIAAYRDQDGTDPTPAYVAAGLPYGPARHDFLTVSELRLVVGMTPALYERLAPHLSVWKLPIVVPGPADPIVAAAYVDAGPNGGFGSQFPTARWLRGRPGRLGARITAIASIDGAEFSRSAEVELRGATQGGPPVTPYQILAWGRPGD